MANDEMAKMVEETNTFLTAQAKPEIETTDYEKFLLIVWPTQYEELADQLSDNFSWTDAAELAKLTGLKVTSIKGILGSMTKKGLVGTDEKPNGQPGSDQYLTEAAVRIAFDLRADPAAVEYLNIDAKGPATPKAAAAPKAKPAPVEVEAPKVGVCARVHQIADAMRGQPRAEIIARAVAEGLNKGTVRVQLGHWAKKQPGGWTWPEPAAD